MSPFSRLLHLSFDSSLITKLSTPFGIFARFQRSISRSYTFQCSFGLDRPVAPYQSNRPTASRLVLTPMENVLKMDCLFVLLCLFSFRFSAPDREKQCPETRQRVKEEATYGSRPVAESAILPLQRSASLSAKTAFLPCASLQERDDTASRGPCAARLRTATVIPTPTWIPNTLWVVPLSFGFSRTLPCRST